jgi:hypothetical protein
MYAIYNDMLLACPAEIPYNQIGNGIDIYMRLKNRIEVPASISPLHL